MCPAELCRPVGVSHPIDCNSSRPTEKTFWIRYFLGVACLSVLLCLLEMLYVLFGCLRKCNKKVELEDEPESQLMDSLPGYNTSNNMLLNPENQDNLTNLEMQLLKNNKEEEDVVVDMEVDGDTGGASTSTSTRALVHHQGRHSYLFPKTTSTPLPPIKTSSRPHLKHSGKSSRP